MGRQLQQFLLEIQSQPPISSNMMKLILALTLLVTLSMAAPMDDGTDVHNTLIADYCAADDAGRDAILVQLEGWCLPTSKMDAATRAFCNEANTSYEEVELIKLSSDKVLPMEFVNFINIGFQDGDPGMNTLI